jgi:hypothetical protein
MVFRAYAMLKLQTVLHYRIDSEKNHIFIKNGVLQYGRLTAGTLVPVPQYTGIVLTGSEKVRSDVILRVVWYDHLPHLGRTRQDALQHIIPRRILHRTGEKIIKFFFFSHSTILRQNNASYLW